MGREVLTVQDTMVHTSTFLDLLLWVGKSSLYRIQWYIPQPSWTSSCGWGSPHCAGSNGTYLNLLGPPPVGGEVLTAHDIIRTIQAAAGDAAQRDAQVAVRQVDVVLQVKHRLAELYPTYSTVQSTFNNKNAFQ